MSTETLDKAKQRLTNGAIAVCIIDNEFTLKRLKVERKQVYLMPENPEFNPIKITEFNDYVQPNLAVADGQLDCNFFQHLPYLESFVKERGSDLVNVGGIHIEPMGVYSRKIKMVHNSENEHRDIFEASGTFASCLPKETSGWNLRIVCVLKGT